MISKEIKNNILTDLVISLKGTLKHNSSDICGVIHEQTGHRGTHTVLF